MQDLTRTIDNPVVHDAIGQFLEESELHSVGEYIQALETLYLHRALGSDVSQEQISQAKKMVRIALTLESELFLTLEHVEVEQNLEAYYLVASIMEYAARIGDRNGKANIEYWIRASIAYLYAGYTANSVFCAKQCDSLINLDEEIQENAFRLILLFLSRRFKEFASLNKYDNIDETEESQQAYFMTSGYKNLKQSLSHAIEYMSDGNLESKSKWLSSYRKSDYYLQRSGVGLLQWVMSRLQFAIPTILDHSLWNIRDIIPDQVISALTHNDEPIYELWTSQEKAVKEMAAKNSRAHSIIALPTSSGKTLITALIIAKELIETNRTAFYVTPLRALVDEISEFFSKYFRTLGLEVAYLPGDYDSIPPLENLMNKHARIFVLTPEKLDLLWRTNDSRLNSAGIFIFDEVQLIRERGRGARLELLVSKMNEAFSSSAKIVVLSAVIPQSNIVEFVNWLGSKSTRQFESTWSPTRRREGLFFRRGEGKRKDCADIMYFRNKSTKKPLLIKDVLLPSSERKPHKDSAMLAWKYHHNFGPVLIYVNQKIEAERIAKHALELAEKENNSLIRSSALQNASQRIHKILGEHFLLPRMVEAGIAYHHADLPDDVKYIIQSLARSRELDIIVSTTTLAEGVNLNIKSVIVSDTWAGTEPMDGIRLLNLAGRAGRAFRDTEGHIILMNASMSDLLLDINKSKIRSRFYSYIESITEEPGIDTDINAIESNLLARAYKKEMSTKDVEPKISRLMKNTLFARQSSVGDYRKVFDKVLAHASEIVNAAELEDNNVLKVFAETGLNLGYCRSLNNLAKDIVNRNDLSFRSASLNWSLLEVILNSCLEVSKEHLRRDARTITSNSFVILKNWLEGMPIKEINKKINPVDSPEIFSKVSYFLFGYVMNDVSWIAAGFVKLLRYHAAERHLSLDREWDLFPSYLKYGTSIPSALLFIASHAYERDEAHARADNDKTIPRDAYDWLRLVGKVSFTTNNSPTEFEKIKENLLSRIAGFSINIDFYGREYEGMSLHSDGDIYLGSKRLISIDQDIVHLIHALSVFKQPKVEFRMAESKQWQLVISL